MKGMGRLWQAAATVDSVLSPGLLEKAAESGPRSLFVGFESVNGRSLAERRKTQNIGRDYGAAVRRLHANGVMVNASFVFGMDGDDETVFDRTVEWAIEQGIETSRFHIMTPYPGTGLFRQMQSENRLLHRDWDLYDTRHVVYAPRQMSPARLEEVIGARTASSTAGTRSGAAPWSTSGVATGCATSRTRAPGRSSSRPGTRSSVAGKSRTRCPFSNMCSRRSVAG